MKKNSPNIKTLNYDLMGNKCIIKDGKNSPSCTLSIDDAKRLGFLKSENTYDNS